MKVVCRHEEEVERFRGKLLDLKKKVDDGELELCEDDGDIIVDGGEITYVTASGNGRYTSRYVDLFFEGKRMSFKNGSGLLGYRPRRDVGWTVVESSHPYRGAFEGKESYYRRMFDTRKIEEIDTLRVAKLPIDYFYKEHGLEPTSFGSINNTFVIVSEHDFTKGLGASVIRVVFDERDVVDWMIEEIEDRDLSDE